MLMSPPVDLNYERFQQLNLRLDMSRGKPSPEQLDLSQAIVDDAALAGHRARDGFDCRNYGLANGLPEARELGAELLGVSAAQVVAAGNSSLELMHDAMAFALLHGVPVETNEGEGTGTPWRAQGDIAFLCPVPGYDRHFSICESLGVRMIPVPMRDDGPDMERVEALVRDDASIKGMWCVPLYSNPSGAVWSDETIRRLAAMRAAPDFRLFWDDAYRFHHLGDEALETLDVHAACAAAGNAERVLMFASLSKVTIAGGAFAWLAAGPRNLAWWQKHSAIRTIGPDKLNQLRHVRFLRDRAGVLALMARHRALLKPKFDAVDEVFRARLSGVEGVRWNAPRGGYFISLYAPEGCARRTVQLAAAAGLILTPAGAAFPYGDDPRDSHLRIAPSFPALEEVRLAAEGIALALLKAVEERRA